jgi:hypothetical protein
MSGRARIVAFVFLLFTTLCHADHVIVTGGPAMRKWENLRVKDDQHDRWWANFVRASTLRMDEIHKAYGPNAPIVWMIYQPCYQARGREDGKPYTTWLVELAAKKRATLVWFTGGEDFIQKLNSRPRGSVETLDYFGHSNRYCFLFDYSNEIMGASKAWLHEKDLTRIKASIFSRNAYCKSWGCHTGESMSGAWKSATGVTMEGARGPTTYADVGHGTLPVVHGGWVR